MLYAMAMGQIIIIAQKMSAQHAVAVTVIELKSYTVAYLRKFLCGYTTNTPHIAYSLTHYFLKFRQSG